MKKKIGKRIAMIVGIIFIVLIILSGLGYLFRDQIVNLSFTKKPGNADIYHLENVEPNEKSGLKGKTLLFLGSSVTRGSAALNVSFIDYMERIDEITVVKEAVSGTTLVTEDENSYIPRMEAMDSEIQADCFVCQLSTNDATKGKQLGTIADSFERADFDTTTVAGAIEYIISYAQDTWNCSVVFYTGTRFDSEEYSQMVDLLLEIQQKWGIGVIDLWNDADMNAVSEEDYDLFMVDSIHPSQAGYLEWWTPKFESYLTEYLQAEGEKK